MQNINIGEVLTVFPAYSYDDVAGDTSFNNFNINAAPSYLYTVLADILSINKSKVSIRHNKSLRQLTSHVVMKVHLTPWSPVRVSCIELYAWDSARTISV